MQAIGVVLTLLGSIAFGCGGIWLLVVAFRESIPWGLCCLFVPFAALAFLTVRWEKASRPFLMQLLGGGNLIVGVLLLARVHRLL